MGGNGVAGTPGITSIFCPSCCPSSPPLEALSLSFSGKIWVTPLRLPLLGSRLRELLRCSWGDMEPPMERLLLPLLPLLLLLNLASFMGSCCLTQTPAFCWLAAEMRWGGQRRTGVPLGNRGGAPGAFVGPPSPTAPTPLWGNCAKIPKCHQALKKLNSN